MNLWRCLCGVSDIYKVKFRIDIISSFIITPKELQFIATIYINIMNAENLHHLFDFAINTKYLTEIINCNRRIKVKHNKHTLIYIFLRRIVLITGKHVTTRRYVIHRHLYMPWETPKKNVTPCLCKRYSWYTVQVELSHE